MPKPTLIQTILGRPSQTYSFPVEKNTYHSTKPELFRLYGSGALTHNHPSSDHPQCQVQGSDHPHIALTDARPTDPVSGVTSTQCLIHGAWSSESADHSDDSDSDINDVFFTPDTSPRTSLVFSTSSTLLISKSMDSVDPPPPPPSVSSRSSTSTVAASTESLLANSVFSSASAQGSVSTRLTTPTSSETGPTPRRRNTLQPHFSPSSSVARLDPSWSNDVRWLVPPSSYRSSPNKPRIHARSPSLPSNRLTKTLAQSTPSITMTMAALLEEDENPASSSTAHHRMHIQTPRSSVIIVDSRGRRSSAPLSLDRTTMQVTPIPGSRHKYRSAADTSRRSSRSTTPQDDTPHGRESDTSASHPRSRSPSRRRSSSASHNTYPFSNSRPISYSPTLPSHGTPGYTSLVLPRAPPPPTIPLAPAVHTGLDGRIDLTCGGIAQTTMATVEVVRGLSAPRGKGIWSALSRRRTIDLGLKSANPDGNEQLSRGDAPLSFTGHRAPPSYVGSSSVLVQVWAVGIDGVDGMLVAEKSGLPTKGKGKPEVGYIPGRSFVGRVLECGGDVRGEAVRKGEWVIGLLDVRKAGALAEFVVVDRHRILRIPYPKMQSPDGQKSRSPSSSSNTSSPLTLQECALLPLCGIFAQRAVRTCLSVISGNAKRRRALVLRGHDGAGAFAAQMFIQHGWHVCVHAPLADRDGVHGSSADDAGISMSVETRVQAWGADGVVFDDGQPGAAVRVLEMLAEEGDVFDAVVDTVGGRDVWEAGSRLLRAGGRGGVFTTLVGDVVDRAVPSASDHLRASMRSLRWNGSGGNGNGGDRGKIEYVWVSIAQDVDWDGADIRESLRAVLALALEGAARPWPGMVVPFERTPEIFLGGLGDSSTLGGGKMVVVKVAG